MSEAGRTVAKFFCAEVTMFPGDNGKVVLRAVTRGDGNKDWAKWTPSGEITLQINNPAAFERFVPGTEYMIYFAPVEVPNVTDGHAFRPDDREGHATCGECDATEDRHKQPRTEGPV